MGKKNQNKTGFYYFTLDIMPDLRFNGRPVNGIRDAIPLAHPRWKLLPQTEKQRYEEMAKREKKKELVLNTQRKNNQLVLLNDQYDNADHIEDRRKKEYRIVRSRLPIEKDQILERKFYFMSVEYLCIVDQQLDHCNDEYLVCEIGMVEFSFKNGITNTYHVFPEPPTIPFGFKFTAQSHSDSTHKIPIMGFDLATQDYSYMFREMENFIKDPRTDDEYPPIFVMTTDLPAVHYSINWLYDQCKHRKDHNNLSKIFELENMIKLLCESIMPDDNPIEYKIIQQQLLSTFWDYYPETLCEYHTEQETKCCALFTVKRFAYALSELFADRWGFELTENHRPKTYEGEFVMRDYTDIYPQAKPNRPKPSNHSSSTMDTSVFPSRDIRYQKQQFTTDGFEDSDESDNELFDDGLALEPIPMAPVISRQTPSSSVPVNRNQPNSSYGRKPKVWNTSNSSPDAPFVESDFPELGAQASLSNMNINEENRDNHSSGPPKLTLSQAVANKNEFPVFEPKVRERATAKRAPESDDLKKAQREKLLAPRKVTSRGRGIKISLGSSVASSIGMSNASHISIDTSKAGNISQGGTTTTGIKTDVACLSDFDNCDTESMISSKTDIDASSHRPASPTSSISTDYLSNSMRPHSPTSTIGTNLDFDDNASVASSSFNYNEDFGPALGNPIRAAPVPSMGAWGRGNGLITNGLPPGIGRGKIPTVTLPPGFMKKKW